MRREPSPPSIIDMLVASLSTRHASFSGLGEYILLGTRAPSPNVAGSNVGSLLAGRLGFCREKTLERGCWPSASANDSMEDNAVEENTIGVSETSISDFEALGSLLEENVLFVSLPWTIKGFRSKS